MKRENFLLVFCSIVLSLVAAELILWIIEPENVGIIQTQKSTPNGTYGVMIPGSEGRRAGGDITVNSAGYRGKLYPVERDAGVTRLMIFGDSFTMGSGVDDDATYPAIVAQVLEEKFPVQVLNMGVGGHDFQQIISYIKDSTLIYNPDYVIFTYHQGDLVSSDFFLHEGQKIEPNSVGRLIDIRNYMIKSSHLARFIIPYAAEYWRFFIGRVSGITDLEYDAVRRDGPEWRAAKREILHLRNLLKDMNIELMFVFFPAMIKFERHPAIELHTLFGAWLESNNIKYLDLLSYYYGYEASRLHATLLDKHPNEVGYAIAGRAVGEWLRKLLLETTR